ncbi:MAG: hypothetical protein U1E73_13735 [Planctomycetota bacterium]
MTAPAAAPARRSTASSLRAPVGASKMDGKIVHDALLLVPKLRGKVKRTSAEA